MPIGQHTCPSLPLPPPFLEVVTVDLSLFWKALHLVCLVSSDLKNARVPRPVASWVFAVRWVTSTLSACGSSQLSVQVLNVTEMLHFSLLVNLFRFVMLYFFAYPMCFAWPWSPPLCPVVSLSRAGRGAEPDALCPVRCQLPAATPFCRCT